MYQIKGLARRFMLHVFLCMSAAMVISTMIELWFGYRYGQQQIRRNATLIRESYLPALSDSLFEYNQTQVELLLQGILKLDGIVYCEILEYGILADRVHSLGHAPGAVANRDLSWLLVYTHTDGEQESLGRLRVIQDYSVVYQGLREGVATHIISSALMICIATLSIMFLFQKLVARHLSSLAAFAQGIDLDHLDSRCELDRKPGSRDELDQVVGALTDLQAKLKQDILERESAEKALQDSEVRLESILNKAPLIIYLKDTRDRYLFVNQQFESFFTTTKARIHGRTGQGIFSPDMTQLLRKDDPAVLVSGKEAASESRIVVDGEALSFIALKFPLLDSSGNIYGLCGILKDITERKKMTENLHRVQKMESIGTLAGGIAHDFNNILFPIMGISEILMGDFAEDSAEYKNLAAIHRAGERGRDLVKQILSFSRQSDRETAPLFIQQILKEILKLIRSTLPANIEIRQKIDPDCGQILADPVQVHQVAMNLITNAFHAVEADGGHITVSLTQVNITGKDPLGVDLKPGGYALLRVSDTGTGIPQGIIHKIFDPYFTTKPRNKGTGLGLSTAYGIVKNHQGEIKVRSETDQGTDVNVYLPLIHDIGRAVVPAAVLPSAAQPRGNEWVLVVDDENDIVLMISQGLARLGYRVDSFTDSRKALAAFSEDANRYDLVISDMTMPGLTGEELSQKMLSLRPDIPVIICTGFNERINRRKALELGIEDFLMKPVIFSELAATIRRVLDGRVKKKETAAPATESTGAAGRD